MEQKGAEPFEQRLTGAGDGLSARWHCRALAGFGGERAPLVAPSHLPVNPASSDSAYTVVTRVEAIQLTIAVVEVNVSCRVFTLSLRSPDSQSSSGHENRVDLAPSGMGDGSNSVRASASVGRRHSLNPAKPCQFQLSSHALARRWESCWA